MKLAEFKQKIKQEGVTLDNKVLAKKANYLIVEFLEKDGIIRFSGAMNKKIILFRNSPNILMECINISKGKILRNNDYSDFIIVSAFAGLLPYNFHLATNLPYECFNFNPNLLFPTTWVIQLNSSAEDKLLRDLDNAKSFSDVYTDMLRIAKDSFLDMQDFSPQVNYSNGQSKKDSDNTRPLQGK